MIAFFKSKTIGVSWKKSISSSYYKVLILISLNRLEMNKVFSRIKTFVQGSEISREAVHNPSSSYFVSRPLYRYAS